MTKGMTVKRFDVENFLGIKKAEIELGDNEYWVTLSGDNGQGKTSLLESLRLAIEGLVGAPAKVLHEGAEDGYSEWHIGDLVVRREVGRNKSGGERQELKVWANPEKAGDPLSSPQTVLDAFRSTISVDPEEFMRMEPRKQRDKALEVFGLAAPLADLDAQYKTHYGLRRDAGVVVKQCESAVGAYGKMPEARPATVDVTDITKARAVETQKQSDLGALSQAVKTAEFDLGSLNKSLQFNINAKASTEQHLKQLQAKILQVSAEIEVFNNGIQEVTQKISAAEAGLARARQNLESAPRPDFESTDNLLRGASEANGLAVRWDCWREALEALKSARQEWATHDKALVAIEKSKSDLVAGANIPVAGVAFSSDGITLNGRPLEQACSKEQIETCCAIAMACNPKIKLIVIRHGSLLGDSARADIRAYASQRGWQVWEERVMCNKNNAVGIWIEDGVAQKLEAGQASQ